MAQHWTKKVPETVPLSVARSERVLKCQSCGERKPESQIERRYIVSHGNVYTCKGKRCWDHWKMVNEK